MSTVSPLPAGLAEMAGLAAAAGPARPSPGLLAALLPLAALVVGIDAYCLISLARAPSVRYLPKPVWAIVIILVSFPLGALLYLFAGRDPGSQHERRAGRPRRRMPGAGSARTSPAPAGAAPALAGPAPAVVDTAGLPDGHAAPFARGTLPPRDPLIVATSRLTRNYGGVGLFDVDLAVPRGSIYGLVGLNGAGKTTLLSVLSATRYADSGTVLLGARRAATAVCPDVPEFDSWLTAAEAVSLAWSMVTAGTGEPTVADRRASAGQAVSGALAAAGLAEAAGRRVGGFSRGMLQRLGLACALVGEPELLILDEPTAALDPAGRSEILDMVAAMRGRRTVIFSSHILADVQRVADQIGILRDGRLLYQGSTSELISTHLTPRWQVRVAADSEAVAAALAAAPWAVAVASGAAGVITVEAQTFETGERGIPAVLAGCSARLVSCEPVAADLEAAFLALTRGRQEAGIGAGS